MNHCWWMYFVTFFVTLSWGCQKDILSNQWMTSAAVILFWINVCLRVFPCVSYSNILPAKGKWNESNINFALLFIYNCQMDETLTETNHPHMVDLWKTAVVDIDLFQLLTLKSWLWHRYHTPWRMFLIWPTVKKGFLFTTVVFCGLSAHLVFQNSPASSFVYRIYQIVDL